MKDKIDCIISGRYIIDGSYDVPANDVKGTPLYQVNTIHDSKTVDEICKSANHGFKTWSSLKYFDRATILTNVISKLVTAKPEIIQLLEEIGLPSWLCHFNADNIVDQLQEYINQIPKPQGLVIQSQSTDLAMTIKSPIGPVLAIAPWNAPGVLTGRTISAPLAAGCSVIIKTNELSVKTCQLIVQCFHDGGVPREVLQMVNVEPAKNKEIVNLFIKNKYVKKISFTGSTAVGSEIALVAGKYIKPCILELGGKNYTIIEPDADVDKSISTTLFNAWGHKGQICMSTDKIFVHESIYEAFLNKLKIIGQHQLDNPDFKILQRRVLYTQNTARLVNDALIKGADIILGSYDQDFDPQATLNYNISPLILGNIPVDAEINVTEIFGSVACIYKYNDAMELVNELNDSEDCGLKASIWTGDILLAHKLAKLMDVGGIHINHGTIFDEPTAPHGGVKSSGYGRFNSSWGIDEFCFEKVVTFNEM